MSEKALLSTKDVCEFCGSEAIFEELEALYGQSLLKPFRTLSNNSRTWSKIVVMAVINSAQSTGTLNDRPSVEAAVEKLRATKRRKFKAQAEHSPAEA